MRHDPIKAAAALRELNALDKRTGMEAAIAYLVGEYPEARDLLASIHGFLADCHGDPEHEDAVGVLDDVCKDVTDFLNKAEELAAWRGY